MSYTLDSERRDKSNPNFGGNARNDKYKPPWVIAAASNNKLMEITRLINGVVVSVIIGRRVKRKEYKL